jgi:hypothetical protein
MKTNRKRDRAVIAQAVEILRKLPLGHVEFLLGAFGGNRQGETRILSRVYDTFGPEFTSEPGCKSDLMTQLEAEFVSQPSPSVETQTDRGGHLLPELMP